MKDSHMQHKKRIAEMMSSLMKDLSEVGTVIGNNTVDIKVQTTSVIFVAVRKTPVDTVTGGINTLLQDALDVL